MSEPVRRGKPLAVRVTLEDALDEATLRTLVFMENSTMRKEARLLLSEALAGVRAQNPEIESSARLIVDRWQQAEHGVSTHEAKGGLRVVD